MTDTIADLEDAVREAADKQAACHETKGKLLTEIASANATSVAFAAVRTPQLRAQLAECERLDAAAAVEKSAAQARLDALRTKVR